MLTPTRIFCIENVVIRIRINYIDLWHCSTAVSLHAVTAVAGAIPQLTGHCSGHTDTSPGPCRGRGGPVLVFIILPTLFKQYSVQRLGTPDTLPSSAKIVWCGLDEDVLNNVVTWQRAAVVIVTRHSPQTPSSVSSSAVRTCDGAVTRQCPNLPSANSRTTHPRTMFFRELFRVYLETEVWTS